MNAGNLPKKNDEENNREYMPKPGKTLVEYRKGIHKHAEKNYVEIKSKPHPW